MKKRNHNLYLKDILDSIAKIEEYMKDLSFDEFSSNTMVIDAVIRNFEVIGEASKHLPAHLKSLHKDIPWKEMAGMRDKMVHEYFGVDLDIVWKTIKDRLPELKQALKIIYNSKDK